MCDEQEEMQSVDNYVINRKSLKNAPALHPDLDSSVPFLWGKSLIL